MTGRTNLKKRAPHWNAAKKWMRVIANALITKIRAMTTAARKKIRAMTTAASKKIRDIKIVVHGYPVAGYAAPGPGYPTGCA